jgi:peptide/nickel transport system ATP-binding protein
LGSKAFLALDKVGFTIDRGEVVGVVGESGSGKTTVARVVAGRLPITAGSLLVDGVDPNTLSGSALRTARGRVGIVYQDPATSLNPLRTVGDSVAEPLVIHGRAPGRNVTPRVEALLESVRLPRSFRHRRPAELSGGQRQRVALARALALDPALLVADEPTSALDVSVQAVVLELLADLQAEHRFACLFISHDLALVHQFSDRVVVMRSGRVVEQGAADVVLRTPEQDYTRRLLAAVPLPDPVAQRARRQAYQEIVNSAVQPAAARVG